MVLPCIVLLVSLFYCLVGHLYRFGLFPLIYQLVVGVFCLIGGLFFFLHRVCQVIGFMTFIREMQGVWIFAFGQGVSI